MVRKLSNLRNPELYAAPLLITALNSSAAIRPIAIQKIIRTG